MQKSGTRPYSGIFTPLLPGLGVFLCVAVPLAYWSGAYDPGWAKTWLSPWPDDAASLLSVLLFAGLLLIPLCWVIKSGAVDLLALGLAQQALIFSGYFFLAATAARVEDSSRGILQSSGLVVLINAVGFLCFFLALGFVYHLAGDRRCRVCPPRIPPAELDRRLLWLNRALLLGCAAAIALPMILTGTVPLLSSGEAGETRMLLIENGLGRAVYHVGTVLLPFVFGAATVFILRAPRRLLGWDGALAAAVILLQILSSNRLPLSIALMVSLALVTMEFKISRWLLAGLLLGYVFLFVFLSGVTSMIRNKEQRSAGQNFVVAGVEEAYLGDNIIDLRDGSWVFSHWDFQPLLGKTYLGGIASVLPSGLFPEKKQWHLGLTAVRIVGLPDDRHFGLRITFFGESFLNFGWAGVCLLAVILGSFFAVLLRRFHLTVAMARRQGSCLCQNLTLLILFQCLFPWFNTGDCFIFWVLLLLLLVVWLAVKRPLTRRDGTPQPIRTAG